ncbi:amidohydrolase [Eupransor demetentiae]|uniref:Metal-dependent amidase/aminoacylase/carboxypeptidase (AbgB) n=1 Tax=Eupransor demetentiae TaxID=3109584 RepID=A0ABM9N462_9LACO|nr:Metal-dependent amidase/aminoacylase/carboxypeptidase (AbgB) [Lactobacillaceae bacterium LMG 33000]
MSQLQDATAIRHYLHQHPELSNQEFKTTAFLKARLEDLGYRIITPASLKTGVVAEIGPENAPVIVLRADIDALPIKEQTGLNYASENEGVMHACGHDFHMTSLLLAAERLVEKADNLTARVRLLFQPAEEINRGAKQVIASGILSDVSYIAGFHNEPSLNAGQMAVKAGARNAAVDRFSVRLKGKGGHAARPHENNDPIVAATTLISALQTIISRNTNPFHPAVLSVTHIEAGSTWNVIPDEAWFEGTIRTFTDEDREGIKKRFYQTVQGQADAFDLEAEIDWEEGPAVLNNRADLAQLLAAKIQDKVELIDLPATTGGEDFALYTQTIPAIFAEIGSGGNSSLHHSDLILDDAGLETAATWYTTAVEGLSELLTQTHEIAQEQVV